MLNGVMVRGFGFGEGGCAFLDDFHVEGLAIVLKLGLGRRELGPKGVSVHLPLAWIASQIFTRVEVICVPFQRDCSLIHFPFERTKPGRGLLYLENH